MRRDRRLIMMLLMMPVLQLLMYGYAATTDIRHLQTVICDQDNSPQSRELIRAVMATPEYFDIVGYVDTQKEAQAFIDSGRASVALIFPVQFARDLAKTGTGEVQANFDGTDPNQGTIAASYLGKIVASEATILLQARASAAGLGTVANSGVDARVQVWYNPTLESSFSLVPGVICMIVGSITIIMSALAIVREREIGTMEQLLVTPMQAWELMLGKLIPYWLLGFADTVMIWSLAVMIFGVPMHGSVFLLLGLAGIFMAGSLGIGLLVSTVARTQMQASMLASFFLMPNMMMSGFMFPIANMPTWLQPVTYVLPMRYYLACVRGIMLKGNSLADLWPEVWPMFLLSLAIFGLAVSRFQKKLD